MVTMWPKQTKINFLEFFLKFCRFEREYPVEDYIKKLGGGGVVINSVFEILREICSNL